MSNDGRASMGRDALRAAAPALERIAKLCALALGSPLCVVALLDGERAEPVARWGQAGAAQGSDPQLCAYVAGGDEPFQVLDCSQDDRFSSHPWVHGSMGVRFFAGAPLHGESGDAIGAVCVMGPRARELGAEELECLADAARAAEDELALERLRGQVEALEEREGRASGEPTLASGLWSQEAMAALLRCDLARGERGQPTTLAAVAIDGLDEAAREHGEDAARALWSGVAKAIGSCMREFDLIGRGPGASFLMIMSNTDRRQGAIACERLRKFVMGQSFKAPGAPMRATLSIGAATTVAGALVQAALSEACAGSLAKASAQGNKYISHPEAVVAGPAAGEA